MSNYKREYMGDEQRENFVPKGTPTKPQPKK